MMNMMEKKRKKEFRLNRGKYKIANETEDEDEEDMEDATITTIM